MADERLKKDLARIERRFEKQMRRSMTDRGREALRLWVGKALGQAICRADQRMKAAIFREVLGTGSVPPARRGRPSGLYPEWLVEWCQPQRAGREQIYTNDVMTWLLAELDREKAEARKQPRRDRLDADAPISTAEALRRVMKAHYRQQLAATGLSGRKLEEQLEIETSGTRFRTLIKRISEARRKRRKAH